MKRDFELTHLLLKELKTAMQHIQYDPSAQKSLFGDTDSTTYYDGFMHTIDTALSAYAFIDNAIECRKTENTIGAMIVGAMLVTGVMALCTTIMPWFVPVYLLASTFLFLGTTNTIENSNLNKASKTLTTINLREEGSLKVTAEKLPDRHSFFSQRIFQHAVRKIGEQEIRQYKEENTSRIQPGTERLLDDWEPTPPLYH